MVIFANKLRFSMLAATLGLCTLVALPQTAHAQFTTFVTGGHADIDVASDEDQLELAVHNDDTDAESDPSETLFVIGDGGLTTRTAEGQTGSAFDFLGVNATDSYFLIKPTGNTLDVPIIGITSEEIDLTEFQDNIAFNLTGFSGPGTFSAYETTPSLNVLWRALSNGTITNNAITSTPSAGHVDYFYGFSAPGLYELTVTASGTTILGESRTASATYFINAGAVAVPEAGTVSLMLGGSLTLVGLITRRRK
ncbi:MAG: hypothetical protein H7Y38_08185 [Armatimonadetes bacterium]|nr:hypothetical protein [Armatimonadota bacterium]